MDVMKKKTVLEVDNSADARVLQQACHHIDILVVSLPYKRGQASIR